MSLPLPTLTPLPTPTPIPPDAPATLNYPNVYNSVQSIVTQMRANGAVDFVLSEFNQNAAMTASGSIETEEDILQANAIATYLVPLEQMKKVFLFATDDYFTLKTATTGVDKVTVFNNAKYYIDSTQPFLNTIQPAWASVAPADQGRGAIIGNGQNGMSYPAGYNPTTSVMMVKHDFIRYLALGLFGTPYGVDLFSNTNELLTNLEIVLGPQQSPVSGAWGNILSMLKSVDMATGTDPALSKSSIPYYIQNSSSIGSPGTIDSATNAVYNKTFTRILLDQLSATNPSRLYGMIQDTATMQEFPFVENDTVNFKVTLKPMDDQYKVTRNNNANPVTLQGRSYIIKLVLKPAESLS